MKRYRALVVDDNKDSADTLACLLEVLGHPAVAFTDPREALNAALATKPHIAFIDIGMPHITGYELARKLREHFPPEELCIVAITGYGDDDARAVSRKSGIDAHLTKPLDANMVEHIIEVVCPQLSPRDATEGEQ